MSVDHRTKIITGLRRIMCVLIGASFGCGEKEAEPEARVMLGERIRVLCAKSADTAPCPANVRAVAESNGRWLILHGQTGLDVVDSSGSRKQVGRVGEGPGEFRFVAAADFDENRTLTTFDVRLFRVDRFDSLLRHTQSEGIRPSAELNDVKVAGRRVLFLEIGGAPTIGDSVTARVTWVDSAGGPRRDPVMFRTIAVRRGGSDLTPLASPFRGKLLWATNRHGEIALANGDAYSVSRFDSMGSPLQQVARDVPQVPVSDIERDSAASMLASPGGRASQAPSYRAQVREILQQLPKHHPRVAALILSSDGDLWVQRGGAPQDSVVWDCFTQAGEYHGTLNLPSTIRLLAVKGDTAVVLDRSADYGEVLAWHSLRKASK